MDQREIILETLLLIEKDDNYADNIIKAVLDKYEYLDKRERSFLMTVLTGVIERRITLDHIINLYSSVKVNKLKPVIRNILRFSIYQIVYMDKVPDSAAINEAVKLSKKKKFNNLSGFVNGVLRNISRNKDEIKMPSKDDFNKYLSVTYSCPEWLCSHFINELGKNEAEELLKDTITKKETYIRCNQSLISPETLKEMLLKESIKVENTEINYVFKISEFDNIRSIEAFNKGYFTVQDLSSVKVVHNASVKAGDFIVDVCAAPGGKSLHAYDELKRCEKNNSGRGIVLARDLSEDKVLRIQENAKRCGFSELKTEVFDALNLDENLLGKVDVLICDLPCSGLGVLKRKSDIKYRVKEEDLLSLSNLQKEILKVVSKYVKKGGTLIYSTCTINKSENEDNADFIESELNFKRKFEDIKIHNGINAGDGFFISGFTAL